MERAAELAAAALLDTLAVCVAAYGVGRCHLALDGDLAEAERSDELLDATADWTVHPQRGADFADPAGQRPPRRGRRVGRTSGPGRAWTPRTSRRGTLTEVGSRLTDPDAAVSGRRSTAAGGSSESVARTWSGTSAEVPMSTARTGDLTREALLRAGARSARSRPLRDVDEVADAESVAEAAPDSHGSRRRSWESRDDRHRAAFAEPDRAHCSARSTATRCAVSLVHACAASAGRPATAGARLGPPRQPCRPELLGHCRGATLDVGCGPGRMSAHLAERGHVVLGVDIVREAVEQARRRGVSALRRNVFDPLPGEGRWNTVLLADGNIGIGGAPVRLLRRAVELLDRTGRVVCDLAAPGTGLRHHDARLVTELQALRLLPVGPGGTGGDRGRGGRRRPAPGPPRRPPRPLVRGAGAMKRPPAGPGVAQTGAPDTRTAVGRTGR